MTFMLFGKQTSNRRTRPTRTDYVQRLVRLNNPKRQFLAVSFVTFPLKLGPVHHYRVIVLRVLDLVLLDAVDWQVLPQSVQRAWCPRRIVLVLTRWEPLMCGVRMTLRHTRRRALRGSGGVRMSW